MAGKRYQIAVWSKNHAATIENAVAEIGDAFRISELSAIAEHSYDAALVESSSLQSVVALKNTHALSTPIIVLGDPDSPTIVAALEGGEIHQVIPLSANEAMIRVAVRVAVRPTVSGLAQPQDEHLRRMMTSMADGILLTHRDSDLVTANPAARQMLGILKHKRVTTQFLRDTLGFYPFDLIVTQPASVPQQEPLREELRIGERVLYSIVSPVCKPQGEVVGVVVVLRELSDAQEVARRQSEFVAVASHELRTPLTAISGALDLLLRRTEDNLNTKQRRYLQSARVAATRLNHVVDDLLEIVRAERKRLDLRPQPLYFDAIVREVATRYESEIQRKSIDLELHLARAKVRVVGDLGLLTQVMQNLISNSIKFAPVGGKVRIDMFGPDDATGLVGTSVWNNGESISNADQERVFAKYDEVGPSGRRKVGGTGLGLAVCRSIIEAHRGRIWVESRPEGAKFVFTLPAAPQEEKVDRPTDMAEKPPVPGRGARLLLLYRDLNSTYILKGLLMGAGYKVSLAGNATEALVVARAEHPALVLFDTGGQTDEFLSLIEIFRHDPDTRKAAVLAFGAEETRERAIGAGASDFLATPLDEDRLQASCARLVSEATRARTSRILVVDDEPPIRNICRDMLEQAGYLVSDCSDGSVALEEAKRFRPDLVLMDVMMPQMDGYETAEKLRLSSPTSMTPIIFLSARGETDDKIRAFRAGGEDYVLKPFDAAELVARVTKTLERHARELAASPTTQLPGAGAIDAELESRLADEGDHAFCYLDLDNLKAFNDYYGYAKADGIIRQTGDLIRDVISKDGGPGDFIGHIAGDDFVFVTQRDLARRLCLSICEAFDRLAPLYYNCDDRERGYIETEDRYGHMRRFPLMGVSVAVVTLRNNNIHTVNELAAAAARGKKTAKESPGSACVVDGQLIFDSKRPTTQPVVHPQVSPSK